LGEITGTKFQHYIEIEDYPIAYFDIIVIPVVSYTFAFVVNFIYKLVQVVAAALFNNRLVAGSKHFTGFLHILLIALVCL